MACVSQSVSIHTEMVPDQKRGPALVNVYRRARPMLFKKCGPRPQEGEKINLDIWLVRKAFDNNFYNEELMKISWILCHLSEIKVSLT